MERVSQNTSVYDSLISWLLAVCTPGSIRVNPGCSFRHARAKTVRENGPGVARHFYRDLHALLFIIRHLVLIQTRLGLDAGTMLKVGAPNALPLKPLHR
jgi:hypothetical protein